jgi:hypothetical protein
MNKARKVVFHSVSQEERQRHYQKDVPIIIVLIILFGTLSVLMDLWQAGSCANPNIGIMT